MSQLSQIKLGSESWKRMSAILLVAVMVIMMAVPMVSVAETVTQDKWDMSEIKSIPPTPEVLAAHEVTPLVSNVQDSRASPDPAPRPWAILDYYTDRPTFDTAAPGLPVEDFENHLIGPNAVQAAPGPWNTATNNVVYAPGGLMPGFSLDATPGDVVLLSTGFMGLPSSIAGPNTFADDTVITFPGNDVNTVGLELYAPMGVALTVDIEIFGIGAVSLGTTTTTTGILVGEFWGVKSNEIITEIVLHDTTDGGELIDDLAFGLTVFGGLDNILMYNDDFFNTAPNTFADQALNAMGLPYTAYYNGNFGGFEADLTGGGPWDLVIYNNENNGPPVSNFNALDTYVAGGGKLIFTTWSIQASPLFANMGVTNINPYGAPPAPVYWWDAGHEFFNNPETVPEFTALTAVGYGTYGHRVEPLPGFTAPAGYTTPGPDANEAAIVCGNGGRTIYKTFLDGQNGANQDADGYFDGVELWINMIMDMGGSGLPFPFLDDFEDGVFSDWSLEGANNDWEIGTPSGLGSPADPVGACTGTFSIGNDLTGLGASIGNHENWNIFPFFITFYFFYKIKPIFFS